MFFRVADPARHARILERRAARARRLKWLGPLVLSVFGMAVFLSLRLSPDLVEDIVARAHDVPPRTQLTRFDAPQHVYVRPMPSDAVHVRRLRAEQVFDTNTQARADTLARALQNVSPGG